MATQTDLWGEIAPTQVRTPAAILREQAALLGSKARNVVEADVTTFTLGNTFYHRFNLVVPGLDGYTYELFTISTDVSPYPVDVGGKQMQTEQEFTEWLRAKLSSPETKKIINNLLAQATT